MKNLTSSQKKVLDFIKKHQEKSGTAPTYEVIASHFGYSTKSTVQYYIEALTAKGYLSKERFMSQGLTLHEKGNLLPLLGKVAAGRPIDYKTQNEKIEVPTSMLKGAGPHFVLQVKGDSMIDEGIRDGDYVVICEQKDARNGDIVVAELEDEATIKRFYKKKGHIELHSANPNYKPILVAEAQSIRLSGVYCGLLRY